MTVRADTGYGPLSRLLTPRAVESADDRYDFPVTTEPWPRIYGGQLFGQACAAAGATVDAPWNLHSLHAHFIRAGDPSRKVVAAVERERDGRQFALRLVTVMQDDEVLLRATASYHGAEPGWTSAGTMPAIDAPEALEADRETVFDRIGDLPRTIALPQEVLIDLDYRLASEDAAMSSRDIWVRTATALPESRRMREAVIAYLSDFTLIGAALLGHRRHPGWRGIRGGSLDHALWLHRDSDPADWLLYAQRGLWTGGARGLAQGMLYDRAGNQVATVMQEALIRPVQLDKRP